MAYVLKKNVMYMMPTHFGPMYGPRQGKDGEKFACRDNPKSIQYAVSFVTDREQLEALLPEEFEVEGEPVVTVAQNYMTEIEWLAGRGYNTLGVTFPVVFQGKRDRAIGPFLLVLWENLADPILTGREQLGYSKIYCELPEPLVCRGATHVSANWLGFRFMDMTLSNMQEVLPDDFPPRPQSSGTLAGTLHYKYIPKTGDWGDPDAAYATLTPEETPNRVVKAMWRGEGTVRFHHARWEDLPTQFMIVNALHDLQIKEYRGATITQAVGGKDISDQCIVQ